MSDGVVAEYALGVGLCFGVIQVIFGSLVCFVREILKMESNECPEIRE